MRLFVFACLLALFVTMGLAQTKVVLHGGFMSSLKKAKLNPMLYTELKDSTCTTSIEAEQVNSFHDGDTLCLPADAKVSPKRVKEFLKIENASRNPSAVVATTSLKPSAPPITHSATAQPPATPPTTREELLARIEILKAVVRRQREDAEKVTPEKEAKAAAEKARMLEYENRAARQANWLIGLAMSNLLCLAGIIYLLFKGDHRTEKPYTAKNGIFALNKELNRHSPVTETPREKFPVPIRQLVAEAPPEDDPKEGSPVPNGRTWEDHFKGEVARKSNRESRMKDLEERLKVHPWGTKFEDETGSPVSGIKICVPLEDVKKIQKWVQEMLAEARNKEVFTGIKCRVDGNDPRLMGIFYYMPIEVPQEETKPGTEESAMTLAYAASGD